MWDILLDKWPDFFHKSITRAKKGGERRTILDLWSFTRYDIQMHCTDFVRVLVGRNQLWKAIFKLIRGEISVGEVGVQQTPGLPSSLAMWFPKLHIQPPPRWKSRAWAQKLGYVGWDPSISGCKTLRYNNSCSAKQEAVPGAVYRGNVQDPLLAISADRFVATWASSESHSHKKHKITILSRETSIGSKRGTYEVGEEKKRCTTPKWQSWFCILNGAPPQHLYAWRFCGFVLLFVYLFLDR